MLTTYFQYGGGGGEETKEWWHKWTYPDDLKYELYEVTAWTEWEPCRKCDTTFCFACMLTELGLPLRLIYSENEVGNVEAVTVCIDASN
jgi:hypothetical protein